MALQNFVDKVGPAVSAAWLNVVDGIKFTIFADAATKAAARTALTSDTPLETVNGGTGSRLGVLSTGVSQVLSGVDSGAVNAYVVTFTPNPALIAGIIMRFTPLNTNTGPSTIGGAAVIRASGAALTGGELSSLGPALLQYTGTQWQIIATAGAQPGFERTATETAGAITPTSYLYANGVPYYDIRRTGGVSDLVTNNTTSFNNAKTALGANGGDIFFPLGDWRGDYRAIGNNITILGQGGVGETNTTCLRPFTTASYTAVTAGSFVIGTLYEIISIGSTDFTLVGAGSNTVGLWFRAVGVGSGTGTARACSSATLLFGDGSNIFRKCGIRDLVISGDDGSGNLADIALGLHGQSNFSGLRYELMQGIHTLHLEPRGGFPITGCQFSHLQQRNDNTPQSITGISIAASAVVTCGSPATANPYAINMRLSFDVNVPGMTQIRGLVGVVTAIGGSVNQWTATVNINSSGFSAYNSPAVTAGSFVVGTQYQILTLGTTNFTLIGATSNTVGLLFIATGVGSGTGTAAPTPSQTNNASARTLWVRRNDLSVGGNYLTNVRFSNFHFNGPPGSATAPGQGAYCIELDGTNSNGLEIGMIGGYIDLKGCTTPASTNACGGVFHRNTNEAVYYFDVNLDPGALGVNVVEVNGATQNPGVFYSGIVVADGQYFKNTASNILIPVGSQSAFRQALLQDPYVMLSAGLIFTNVLDPFGNKAADAGAPLPVLNEDGPLGPITLSNADWSVKTVGKGLRVKEGSNAKQGVSAAMTAGTVTVSNTAITANSRLVLTRQAGGTNPGAVYESARTAGTSFVITSTNAADTGTVAYQIFEPA